MAVKFAGLIVFACFLAGCKSLQLPPNEEYRQEGNKTVYRSADHADAAKPQVEPQEKIPGE